MMKAIYVAVIIARVMCITILKRVNVERTFEKKSKRRVPTPTNNPFHSFFMHFFNHSYMDKLFFLTLLFNSIAKSGDEEGTRTRQRRRNVWQIGQKQAIPKSNRIHLKQQMRTMKLQKLKFSLPFVSSSSHAEISLCRKVEKKQE